MAGRKDDPGKPSKALLAKCNSDIDRATLRFTGSMSRPSPFRRTIPLRLSDSCKLSSIARHDSVVRSVGCTQPKGRHFIGKGHFAMSVTLLGNHVALGIGEGAGVTLDRDGVILELGTCGRFPLFGNGPIIPDQSENAGLIKQILWRSDKAICSITDARGHCFHIEVTGRSSRPLGASVTRLGTHDFAVERVEISLREHGDVQVQQRLLDICAAPASRTQSA